MTVFLMTIRETLPPTEKTPLISKKQYFQLNSVEKHPNTSICIILNVFHLILFQR